MTIKLAKDLQLPADIASLTTAVLGIRGSGKTSTAVCISEDLITAGDQVVIIDPLDVWWGLRSSADGKKAGCPIAVLGGQHGDVPISEADAVAVADVLTEYRQSAVISLRHLSKSSQRRFMAEFAERVYVRKGEPGRNTRCLFIIDEASAFVPQRFDSSEARMVGAIEDWVRRGRASGIGVMLIDQRAASVNKDVLTQIEMLVAHRSNSPQDRKALKDWIDAHDTADHGEDFLSSLASLKTGEAWFWSPSWLDIFQRAKVRMRRTFDSSATPTGGVAISAPKGQATIDVAGFRQALNRTIEKTKAENPAELRKQIADLQKQLAVRPAAEPTVVEVPVIGGEFLTRLEKLVIDGRKIAADIMLAADEFSTARAKVVTAPSAAPKRPQIPAAVRPAVAAHKPAHNLQPKIQSANGQAASLNKAERAILTAFYWLKGEAATQAKVAFYSNYTAGAGSFNNALGSLRSAGLLKGWSITADGIAAAESFGVGQKPTGSELREWLRAKLNRAENAILDALIEMHPDRIGSGTIGELSGYTPGAGSFNNALGRLRSIEAAEGYERDGGTKAADVFFE